MVHDTRELNRGAVLAGLLCSRPASRKQIAGVTGISAATVTRIVNQLIDEGVLREGEEIVVERRGRRARLVDLTADRTYVLGIDLGASTTRVVATDLVASPHAVVELPTPTSLAPRDLVNWLVDQVSAASAPLWAQIGAVALGLPGAVSQAESVVSNAPNLPQVEDPSFLRRLHEHLGKPLTVDNDANFALLGEQRFGAAQDAPNAAMLTLGAGLGSALSIDGRILRGRHGLVGEFGQLPVGPLGTPVEGSVTGPGILRRAAESGIHLESPAQLFAASPADHSYALRSHFDHALLIVLTAIAVSCEPEIILLGGGISKSLAEALERYQQSLQHTLRFSPRLVPASLGDFSGAVGAVVSALHHAYRNLGVPETALAELPATGTLDLQSISQARERTPRPD